MLLSWSSPSCRRYRRPRLGGTTVFICLTASAVLLFLSQLCDGPSVFLHPIERRYPTIPSSLSTPLAVTTALAYFHPRLLHYASVLPSSSNFTAPTILLRTRQAVSPFSSFAKKCRRFSRIYAYLSSYALRAIVFCIHSYMGSNDGVSIFF